MQSAGGTLTPEIAQRKPAHLVESGPAAGVMACAYLGRLTGQPQLISLDMGGTTAKAAIVEDGLPVRTSEYEVGAGINLSSKLVKGGGHPIKLPFIDVSEIGAGGGSIVARRRARLGQRRPGERRRLAGPGLLRPRRARADAHRRAARPRLPQRDTARRWCDHAERRRRRARRSTASSRRRSARSVEEAAYGDPAARGRHDDARGQGRHDLPRPRPARLHALRLRRQRPADRRRDRARPADPPRAGATGAGRLQRPRPALLRHRARDRAHPDAARDGARPPPPSRVPLRGARGARRRRTSWSPARRPSPSRGSPTSATPDRPTSCPCALPAGAVDVARLVADFVAEHVTTYGHGSADDPIDVVSIRALARVERTTARKYDPLAAIRDLPPTREHADGLLRPGRRAVETPVCNRAGAARRASGAGPLLSTRSTPPASCRRAASARLDAYGNIEVEIDG